MRGELTRDFEIRPGSIALWTGILAPPLAWAATLQLKYALMQYICANHATWILWTITITALVVCALGAFSSRLGLAKQGRTARVLFMARGGFVLSALFALTIIAMAIPDFFLRACD